MVDHIYRDFKMLSSTRQSQPYPLDRGPNTVGTQKHTARRIKENKTARSASASEIARQLGRVIRKREGVYVGLFLDESGGLLAVKGLCNGLELLNSKY